MDVIFEASSGDTYQSVTTQVTTGLHVIIAKIDEAGNVISLSIDGAADVVEAAPGAFNAQVGGMLLGAGLVAGNVEDQITTRQCVYAAIYDGALDETRQLEALNAALDELKPISIAIGTLNINQSGVTDIDLTPYLRDPCGGSLTLIGVVPRDLKSTQSLPGGLIVRFTPSGAVGDTTQCTVVVQNTVPGGQIRQNTVLLTATITSSAYANGFRKRVRVELPPLNSFITSASLTRFPKYFDITLPQLKSVANGGEIYHAQAYDFMITDLNNNPWDFELTEFNLSTGRFKGYISVPLWAQTQKIPLYIWFSKPSQTEPSQNPQGVWQDYWAVWNVRTGQDRTGNGRHLTPTNIGNGTMLTLAGAFNGVNSLVQADAAAIGWGGNGSTWNKITFSAWAKANNAGQNRGVVAEGPPNPAGTACSIALYMRTANAAHTVVNPMLSNISCGIANNEKGYTISDSNRHPTVPVLYHLRWQSGEIPAFSANGVTLPIAPGLGVTATGFIKPLP